MSTIEKLYTLDKKPKINEINLKLLIEYWIKYLQPFEIQYTLDDVESNVISLRFPAENFAHLLGIETIAKRGGVKYQDLKSYRGQEAYNSILANTLTFDSLKSLNSTIFKSVKDKFIYFYQLPHLVVAAKEIINFTKVPGSYIECELLIYNAMHDVYVHLGLEKESSGQFYIPRTFLIERNLGTKYLDAQTEDKKRNILNINKVTL
ncbi:PBECR4 domain-containing protein [Psychrobacillus sp. FSL H8-0510]|uniref:PBECR4 domain-containing protein n=1 Tax=Psychrobacillus sp. FSL H8-0510 TaxID=2921394 RepID=UPI0030F8EEAB